MTERPLRVHVLKSGGFGAPGTGGPLPYRIDLLERSGIELTWTDRHLSPTRLRRPWLARRLLLLERATTPFQQAILSRRALRHADVVLAVFESEGHLPALLRSFVRRGPRVVIVSCWLADLAADAGDAKRRLYRRIYRGVDLVTVFSSNQSATLQRTLGIDPARIGVLTFGVDTAELAPIPTSESGHVVAAGRDLGRDWATLADAARGAGWHVDLITRPAQAAAVDLPEGVTVHGYVERPEYLRLLAEASVAVVPTEVREYPTGQTVLLEAMALGKACVVTDTPAMREYVTHDESALLVPPHDAAALRAAVDRLLTDDDLRARIGANACAEALARFDAGAMWDDVARRVRDLLG